MITAGIVPIAIATESRSLAVSTARLRTAEMNPLVRATTSARK